LCTPGLIANIHPLLCVFYYSHIGGGNGGPWPKTWPTFVGTYLQEKIKIL